MRVPMKLIKSIMLLTTGITLFASLSFAATLTVTTKDGIGSYLVDDKGMALYLYKKDMPNMSMCENGCLAKWPAFFADTVDPNVAIDKTAVGTITRADGVKQTTYKGQPLYYFINDKDANDVYGQGMGNVWFVVAP